MSVIGLPASSVSMIPSSRALRVDQVRPAQEDPLAVAGVRPAPAAVVRGPARGRDRRVDVRGAAPGDLRERPARRRVLGREPRAAGRVAEPRRR